MDYHNKRRKTTLNIPSTRETPRYLHEAFTYREQDLECYIFDETYSLRIINNLMPSNPDEMTNTQVRCLHIWRKRARLQDKSQEVQWQMDGGRCEERGTLHFEATLEKDGAEKKTISILSLPLTKSAVLEQTLNYDSTGWRCDEMRPYPHTDAAMEELRLSPKTKPPRICARPLHMINTNDIRASVHGPKFSTETERTIRRLGVEMTAALDNDNIPLWARLQNQHSILVADNAEENRKGTDQKVLDLCDAYDDMSDLMKYSLEPLMYIAVRRWRDIVNQQPHHIMSDTSLGLAQLKTAMYAETWTSNAYTHGPSLVDDTYFLDEIMFDQDKLKNSPAMKRLTKDYYGVSLTDFDAIPSNVQAKLFDYVQVRATFVFCRKDWESGSAAKDGKPYAYMAHHGMFERFNNLINLGDAALERMVRDTGDDITPSFIHLVNIMEVSMGRLFTIYNTPNLWKNVPLNGESMQSGTGRKGVHSMKTRSGRMNSGRVSNRKGRRGGKAPRGT